MSTWWWVLVWVVLVLLGLASLAMRAWGLWGQVKELTAEIGIAQQRISGVQGQLELLGEQIHEPSELAVFGTPNGVGEQRRKWDDERETARRTSATRKSRVRPTRGPRQTRDVH